MLILDAASFIYACECKNYERRHLHSYQFDKSRNKLWTLERWQLISHLGGVF